MVGRQSKGGPIVADIEKLTDPPQGFRTRSPTRKSVSEMWLWFHFPLHLSLIMVLEGVKNLFSKGRALIQPF